MKKIFIISPYIGIDDGETREAIIARYLERFGYRVIIITASTDSKFNSENKPYVLVKRNSVKYMLINIEVHKLAGKKRVLAQLKFQILAYHYSGVLGKPNLVIGNFAGLFGDIVFKYKKQYKAKVILDILDFWPEVLVELGYLPAKSAITKVLYFLEHRSYHCADSIFSSIEGFKDYIIDKGWNKGANSVEISKIHYINNGIEIEKVDRNKEKWILQDIDLERNDVYKVGYIGSIGEPNHIDMVVEAARIAKEENLNILFLIYGNGGQLRNVKKLAENYGLQNIVFKGFLEKKYFPSTISRCNIALLNFENAPSLRYGMSNNKFFMYCASGIPVLSTVHPGHSIIENRKCGLIVGNTPKDLIYGVKQFMKMKDIEFEEYKRNARIVGEEYDYNKMLFELKGEIARLIGE